MGLTTAARWRLLFVAVLAVLSVVGFMTWNVQSDWAFIIEYRGSRLLAMLLVAVAMGVSTLVFQTLTHSRILTPSLMGFDVLYVLVHALGLACVVLVFTLRRRLDVLNLGRDVAINLGVPYQRTVTLLLVVASVLVSVSTALVGPMLFFGLLATNLAYWLVGTHQHRWTLLGTVLVAVVCLIGGQLLIEQILHSRLPFVMLLELCGGVLFILLLLRGVRE